MARERKKSRLRPGEPASPDEESFSSVLAGAAGVGAVVVVVALLVPGIHGGGDADRYGGVAPSFTARTGAAACLDLDALIRLEAARSRGGSGAAIEGCTELVPGQRVQALEARDPYLCVLPEGRRNCLWAAQGSLAAAE